jgi:hypothetical protein
MLKNKLAPKTASLLISPQEEDPEEMSELAESDLDMNYADIEDNPDILKMDFFDEIDEGKSLCSTDDSIPYEKPIFNNSFTGPYPEDIDHIHMDKGTNPQFADLVDDEGYN